MATAVSHKKIEYPTSDGRPMAETDHHRNCMLEGIETIKLARGHEPDFYVSGNLLVFYVPGDRRRHVAPDFFVVRGVPNHERDNYLIWEEGKAPEVTIEYTSKTTRKEDQGTKFVLYRDTLKVKEYFQFDPFGDYLQPRLIGHRLRGNRYVRIRPVAGRLPSQVLGLHLEAVGDRLRFYDPSTGRWLPTPDEAREQAEAAQQEAERRAQQAEAARQHAEALRQEQHAARQRAETAKQQAEAEVERLRRNSKSCGGDCRRRLEAHLHAFKNATRSASSRGVICWSRPAGMTETLLGWISSISSRAMRTSWLGPVARITSSAFLPYEAIVGLASAGLDQHGLVAAHKAGAGEDDRFQKVALGTDAADLRKVRADLPSHVTDGVTGRAGCPGAVEHRTARGGCRRP